MERTRLSRYVIFPLLAAAALLTAGSALAQRTVGTPVQAPAPIFTPPPACPEPIHLKLDANTPDLFSGDFTPGMLSHYAGLNDPSPNKPYLHTFQWTPRHRCCCQITQALLTVHMQANQSGSSHTGSDAGNDGISVLYNGAVVTPYAGYIYPNTSFPAGQTATTTWNLQGAALANINASNRLTFYVEDDTRVTSATLELFGCCLTN